MGWRQQVMLYWQGQGAEGVSEKSTTFHTQSNPAPNFGTAQGVIDAAQALSVGAIKTASLCPIAVYSAVPGPGPYSSARDYAKVFFRCADQTSAEFIFAAPRSDIWTAGTDKLNLSHPDVQALVNACTAAMSNGVGSPVVSAEDGRRYRIKVPR